jgi:hypothetical protein
MEDMKVRLLGLYLGSSFQSCDSIIMNICMREKELGLNHAGEFAGEKRDSPVGNLYKTKCSLFSHGSIVLL